MATEWAYWEEWEYGWQLRDGWLYFEDEDITELLPPYEVVHQGACLIPVLPSVNQETDPVQWKIRFLFENGWEAEVGSEWGVAKNAATLHGLNRRVLGTQSYPKGDQWDDLGLCWSTTELDLDAPDPYLDDPDQLIACIVAIAVLPSDPEVRRLRAGVR